MLMCSEEHFQVIRQNYGRILTPTSDITLVHGNKCNKKIQSSVIKL